MHNLLTELIEGEKSRQKKWIELIASENYPSKSVQERVWSIYMAKYAEGYPNESDSFWQKGRYYGGCEFVDILEKETKQLAMNMFWLNKAEWHVNVQPHSGSNANEATLMSILNLGDKILSFDLSHWWHLSHWMKLNTSGRNYKIKHYWVDKKTKELNYDDIEKIALKYKPKLIIAWASAYPSEIDFKRFRDIASKVWAYLMTDIAHIAWLIVAWEHNSPFEAGADFVTTTTHKTLRWNRWGLIFSKIEYAKKIDTAIFPWIQGWPLMNEIAWKYQTFYEANTNEFKEYIKQVKRNAKTISDTILELIKDKDYKLLKDLNVLTNWTENHLLLLDFSNIKIFWKKWQITGLFAQKILEKYDITVNKNLMPFDKKSPKETSWIRIGTPAITSRWLNESNAKILAKLILDILIFEIKKEFKLDYIKIHQTEDRINSLKNIVLESLNSIWLDWKDFLN